MVKKDIITQIDAFPPQPDILTTIISLLNYPVADQKSAVIKSVELKSIIVEISNSCFFNPPIKIEGVEEALDLWGPEKILQLAGVASLYPLLKNPVPGYDLPQNGLWQHSIAVILAVEDLAAKLRLSTDYNYFFAGIIHDMGKYVLGPFVDDAFEQLQTEVAHANISFEAAEKKLFGISHGQVTALILEQWSFPSAVIEAVRRHHDPDSVKEHDKLKDLIHVANVLCLMVGIGVGREGQCYGLSASAARRLALRSTELEAAASHTMGLSSELADNLAEIMMDG